jgi:hypothetical protein
MLGQLAIVWFGIQATHASASEDWAELFDGRSLSGWKAAENPQSFRAEDGTIVCDGPRAHLFYTGDVGKADFKNFELKAEVKTAPGANSGIYFHTEYQAQGFPDKGFEVQINNSYSGHGRYYEYKKTGSLYGIRNQFKSLAEDNRWFTVHLVVSGRRVRISIDGVPVTDYVEPAGDQRPLAEEINALSRGTFALQCHDPASKVSFRNILVRPLADDLADSAVEPPPVDATYAQILELNHGNFPLVDFHVHLKGGLTLDEAKANSRETGIQYGIAPNCGLDFPIKNDEEVLKFLDSMRGQPVFIGMQAEGREWVEMFSLEVIRKFDYAFTDAMTFTDEAGRRIHLWKDEEVRIDDPQAFMEMYVQRTVGILNHEPIDILANPTFLPSVIRADYDALWTPARFQRVIDAAVKNGVAIEINARNRVPSAALIKQAKASGATFSLGTNNAARELGRLEYCLEMIRECGLTSQDMFMPNRLREVR